MKVMHLKSKHLALPLQPRNSDILCGRGSTIDEHPGNMHFRQVVNEHKAKYMEVERKGKKKVALALMKELEQMVPPARFLVRDTDNGNWIEASHKTAYNKITQTLRQARKQKRKKVSLPLPQNKLCITTQVFRQVHQEPQEVKSTSENHPCMQIASASNTDNPIHREKHYKDNMFRITQVPCPFPGMSQISYFHEQYANQASMTDIFRNTVKHNNAYKNPNKRSIFTNQENPVTVPNHPEELQETMSTKGNVSEAFTSDEVEHLSKVFLGDNHQHNHRRRKSSSSQTEGQCQQEHSMPLNSPKKRQRIVHAEQSMHLPECNDDWEVDTAATFEDKVGAENDVAEYVDLLANYILGESDACHDVKSEFAKLDNQIFFEDDLVSCKEIPTEESNLYFFSI